MERSDLTEEQAAKIISRCQEEMNKEPAKPAPAAKAPAAPASDGPRALFLPATLAWLTANETAVNTFLVAKNWAKSGQTFRDLSPDRAESIITKADAFAKAAGIPTLN